jgi:hypothetical protein
MGCQAEHGHGSSLYRDERFKHLVRPNTCPIYDDLQVLLGLDLQPVMKLPQKTTSHNLFAGIEVNAVIRDKAPDTLEVVSKLDISLEAASDFSKYQASADEHACDNLADGILLGWE